MKLFRDFTGLHNVHFVGIGGAGMSGIAEVLLDYNVTVSGCDRARGEAVDRLESLGVTVAIVPRRCPPSTPRSWRRARTAFRWCGAPRCWRS
jgi:Mur ligase family, catalytic domain